MCAWHICSRWYTSWLPHCNQQCFNICPTMAPRSVSWHKWNLCQVFVASRWMLPVSIYGRLLTRLVCKGSKEQETPGPHTANRTCGWLQCCMSMQDCPYSPSLYTQAMVPQFVQVLKISVVTTAESGVYRLLPMCHVYIKVRIKFLVSECLLPYFQKLIVHVCGSELLCWSL